MPRTVTRCQGLSLNLHGNCLGENRPDVLLSAEIDDVQRDVYLCRWCFTRAQEEGVLPPDTRVVAKVVS